MNDGDSTTIERAMSAKQKRKTDPDSPLTADTNVTHIREQSGWNPPPSPPSDYERFMLEDNGGINIGQIAAAVWFHRGIFALLALLLATILVVGNQQVFPDRFRAVATVRVNSIDIDDTDRSEKVFRIIPSEILSDRVLVEVIETLNLTERDKVPVIEEWLTKIGVETNKNFSSPSVALRWLKKDVEVIQEVTAEDKPTPIFSLVLVDKDPEIASNVINEIVDEYLKLRLELDSMDSGEALKFLTEKMAATEDVIRQAGIELSKYQTENAASLVRAGTFETSIEALREEARTSEIRIEEINILKKRLENTLKQENRYSLVGDERGRHNSVYDQIQYLDVKLASAKADFTPTHPVVVKLEHKIRELRAQMATDGSTLRRTSSRQYLELSMDISMLAAERTALERRLPQIDEEIAEFNDKIVTSMDAQRQAALLQSEWDKANDDYKSFRDQYNIYKTRAEAQLSDAGQDLTVLDYSTVPTLSASAPRSTLMILGFVGGIIIALVITMIISRAKKWEVPETTKKTGSLRHVFVATIGLIWFTALIGYIVITPYI